MTLTAPIHEAKPILASVPDFEDTTPLEQADHPIRATALCPDSPPIPTLPTTASRPAGWVELRMAAENFETMQEARKAIANRLRTLDPELLEIQLSGVLEAEAVYQKALVATYKRVVPVEIREWQAHYAGLGAHLVARLLGHVGDPRWAEPYRWEGTGTNRVLVALEPYERTVGQLWQYCGVGAPARKRRGMSAEEAAALGNPATKSILWNLATACVRCKPPADQIASALQTGNVGGTIDLGQSLVDTQASGAEDVSHRRRDTHIAVGDRWRYRRIYDERRAVTAEREHATECVRCGPSGKPAQPGSPWSKGHQQADALRIVSKAILRDLWIVTPALAAAENQMVSGGESR